MARRIVNKSVKSDLLKQKNLQKKIEHNLKMGYIPSANDIAKLKKYEKETGVRFKHIYLERED